MPFSVCIQPIRIDVLSDVDNVVLTEYDWLEFKDGNICFVRSILCVMFLVPYQRRQDS